MALPKSKKTTKKTKTVKRKRVANQDYSIGGLKESKLEEFAPLKTVKIVKPKPGKKIKW